VTLDLFVALALVVVIEVTILALLLH